MITTKTARAIYYSSKCWHNRPLGSKLKEVESKIWCRIYINRRNCCFKLKDFGATPSSRKKNIKYLKQLGYNFKNISGIDCNKRKFTYIEVTW